ncbi:hypothetical protein K9K77_02795 [Candidatus Babeliales bacterium]|nr:hypothetical protein [Candidatus Babeliales bacterium]
MKRVTFFTHLFILLFVWQSALYTCPTSWGLLQLNQQTNHDVIGEMEVSNLDQNENLTEDTFDCDDDDDYNDDYEDDDYE